MDQTIIHNKIYAKIKEAENILLVTHERPDVDAVSSVCAMIEFLEKEGKDYFAYSYDTPPHQYKFLPHVEKINSGKESFNFYDYDLIIVFDCGAMSRTKLTEEIMSKSPEQFIIEIDHHLKVEDYANLELRDPGASSTTELVYLFFKANKIKINKNIANCILAGILTDSGNFIYSSTSTETVKISGEMLMRGASLAQIMENTLRNKNLPALKVWGRAMDQIKLNKKYNIAFSLLTLKDIGELEEEDIEGIANFLGNMDNVKAILLLREQKDGSIKGSFRSAHPTVNVANLARALGGGGHAKASGFTIEGIVKKTQTSWKIL